MATPGVGDISPQRGGRNIRQDRQDEIRRLSAFVSALDGYWQRTAGTDSLNRKRIERALVAAAQRLETLGTT